MDSASCDFAQDDAPDGSAQNDMDSSCEPQANPNVRRDTAYRAHFFVIPAKFPPTRE